MKRRGIIITNICIAFVLVGLTVAVFTADLSGVFLTVSAPVSHGNRNRNNVSLMISVCEDSDYLVPLKHILMERDIDATWFLSGSWVARNMEATRIISQAFEVGNHAYTHRDMRNMSENAKRLELQNTRQLIHSVTGMWTQLFHPPYGQFNRTTLRIAENLDYITILYSHDASHGNQNAVFTRATQNVGNGDLILLKPSEAVVAALPSIIDNWLIQGFNIVAVSDNIS